MKAMARYRHERSEVSVVIKYLVFGFNVLFWVSVIILSSYYMQFVLFCYSSQRFQRRV